MNLLRAKRNSSFDTEQVWEEEALRGKTARRVRAQLRRLEPVAMLTPRWSAPQSFLEDIALDLAVGEPAIGCRTISFRPLLGRSIPEAWNFLLRVLAELPGNSWEARPVPMVVDRRGFYYAAEFLLGEAHLEAPYPVALLGHGCEHLPVEVLEDIALVWARYAAQAREDRRCTVLLSGCVDTPALDVGGAAKIELTDFAEPEAAASLVMQVGATSPVALARAARFSGGVPAIINAIAGGAAEHGIPAQPEDLLRCMGPVAEDIRGAMMQAMAHPDVADRLYQLLLGEPMIEEPQVDRELLMAGLLRRVHQLGPPMVELRSPVLAAVAI